ncbi:DNA mismatch repair protein PMS1 [Phytophthora ramorum]|uniref:DNA mismatch repair protein PMS1 n=1 Tax=Phytophthora ramorum TaxID=164328 RepID=UPI0030A02FE4|nr:DNA mismatch repair protein PMS1 [Phytophthora ramorum]
MEEEEDTLSGQVRKVEGYVSKVGAGVGRSDNDRQFFFINGRPLICQSVAPIRNEAEAGVCTELSPSSGDYDVNVTPDKRETFVKHEAEIIDAFKRGLNTLYEPSRGTFTVQPLMTTFARVAKPEESTATSIPHLQAKKTQQLNSLNACSL